MAGARPPAGVGAPGAGFHGVAPAGDDAARCAETGRTRDTGGESGRSAAAGAVARARPGEWLADPSPRHAPGEAGAPGVLMFTKKWSE